MRGCYLFFMLIVLVTAALGQWGDHAKAVYERNAGCVAIKI